MSEPLSAPFPHLHPQQADGERPEPRADLLRPLHDLDRMLARAAPFGVRNPLKARQLNLLFVDDQHFVRQTISLLLNDRHLNVRFAENGVAAVEAYISQPPHMVFLDIDMPDISGLKLLELLVRRDPMVYPVMLTGEATLMSVRLAKEHGVREYIAKPFNRQQLIDCVQRYLNTFRVGQMRA